MGAAPLYLNIINTSNKPQPASIFNAQNQGGQTSLFPTYSWDLTAALADAALYNSNYLTVVARPNSNGAPYQQFTYTSPSTFTTVTQVLNALNLLGIGTFSNPSGNNVTLSTSGPYVLSTINISNAYPALLSPFNTYNKFGALVYDTGYQSNGVGNFTRINPAVPFWINPLFTLSDGRMNNNSMWNNAIPVPLNQQVGISTQITVPVDQQVYLALSADDKGFVYLNNKNIITFDVVAMGINIGNILGPSFDDGTQAFSFWHAYPINLVAGVNTIQAQNVNSSGLRGGIGVEIYNNTAAEILAATGYGDLDLLFGSASYAGQNLF